MSRSDFSKWFEEASKDKGNDKEFRNRKSMEMAWNAGQEEQWRIYADAVIAELKSMGFQLYVIGEARIRKACINAVEEK